MDNGLVQHPEGVFVPTPLQVCNHSDEIEGFLTLGLQYPDVLLEGEARIPSKPEEFRRLLHWQRCVTNPHSRGLLNPGTVCSEMYDFAFVGCKSVAHSYMGFTVCCKWLSMVSRERPRKHIASSSTKSALKKYMMVTHWSVAQNIQQPIYHQLGHFLLGRIHQRVWCRFWL